MNIQTIIMGIIDAAVLLCSFFILWKAKSIKIEKNTQITEEKAELEKILTQKADAAETVKSLNKEISELDISRADKLKELTEDYQQQQEKMRQSLKLYQDSLDFNKSSYIDRIESAYSQTESRYQQWVKNIQSQQDIYQKQLDSIRATVTAANQAIQRANEDKLKKSKYMLQVSDKSLKEINIIRSVEDKLTDPRPLRMIIWSTYFSKPANDLCTRVLGKNTIMGIYKITNNITNMTYIGQSKDIKTRWRDHMKCGLGIDTPAGNKLYAAMIQDGIENFTFELLETCLSNELDEKEKLYIELYDSYNFGYNLTKGNSKKEK